MTRKIRNDGRAIDVSASLPAMARRLAEEPGLVAVYLFGSYGTTSQTPLSDVDLALLFEPGREPSAERHAQLIGLVMESLREDDVSVMVLNRAPLALRHKVLAEGRPLVVLDEIALADFVEQTITRYSDFAVDEARLHEGYDRALVEEYCGGAG